MKMFFFKLPVNCRVMLCILYMCAGLRCLYLPLQLLCSFKVMHYLYHNVSKSMCLALIEGTIGNKSCVSFWRLLNTFCTKSLCEILGKITVELCVLP